ETERHFFADRHPLEAFLPLNFYELATSRVGMFSVMAAFSIRAYDRFRELLQAHRFDVVHDNQVLGYGTLLIRASGVPTVATVHHPLVVDRRNRVLEGRSLYEKVQAIIFYPFFMQEVVARRLDRVVSVSGQAARAVRQAFALPEERVVVVHNGVDTELFRPCDEVPKRARRLVFVGRSDDVNKGARYLLEALNILKDEVDFRLTLVDDVKTRLRLAPRLVREFGLSSRVDFSGRVSQEGLVRLYNEAEVVVSPSLYEGFGLPAAEAMACGTPVVATGAGAFPELIEDGATGVLVPARDVQALAAALRRLLADPARARAMGAAARQRVAERFTWRRAAEKLVQLYEEVGR
ncbi:unnamed protein product, partial [marine sediment metagenome]